MKKVYQKPAIVFESFALSTSIAAACRYESDKPIDVGGFIILAEQPCLTVPQDGDYGMCYHVPQGDNNIFAS